MRYVAKKASDCPRDAIVIPFVKDICRAAITHQCAQLEAWLVERFPRKQQEAA